VKLEGMTTSIPLVVFTDLDGTLLDHVTYDWEPARPALAELARIGAPVVLSSSKTAAEIAQLQDRLGLTGHLAICENGCGLIGARQGAGPGDHAALRRELDRLPPALRQGFRGFTDMHLSEVMDLTGLSRDDAARAKARDFSEPGLWLGDDAGRAAFVAALGARGVTARQGGRFLTLSFGGSKADRMAEVIAHYRPARTIALGDAPNDIEMLEAADIGVIVGNPHHSPLPRLRGEDKGRIIRTDQPGPVGWNRAVLALLDRLGLQKERQGHG
jgi:mannosyl-3-phosphoglycerate phosphatase